MMKRVNIAGKKLEFSRGYFDEWCVYVDGEPLRDIDYFSSLYEFKYEGMYDDFISVYELTDKKMRPEVFKHIHNISPNKNIELIFSILYMTMIAEENKENTILGKRIKRLGVYKVLVENKSVKYAANFLKGVWWYVIDEWCKERGF